MNSEPCDATSPALFVFSGVQITLTILHGAFVDNEAVSVTYLSYTWCHTETFPVYFFPPDNARDSFLC